MKIDEITRKLTGKSLMGMPQQFVYDSWSEDRFMVNCYITGMPACCGLGLIKNMNMDKDQFEKLTEQLHAVVEENHATDAGVGAYIATTGYSAGIDPEYFRENDKWKLLSEYPNPVHEGTEMQIWLLGK